MRAFWACWLLVLFGVLLNPRETWVHGEARAVASAVVGRTGAAFSRADFKEALNYRDFDIHPRARFLSALLFIWNIKLRLALFGPAGLAGPAGPPWPGLSLCWVFGFVVSPWLLHRLLLELTGRPRAAWIGATLYLVSPGLLSGLALFFHPAKPMGNFFILLSLLLARRRAASACPAVVSGAAPWILNLSVLAGLLFDEAAGFLVVAVPALCPELFFPFSERRRQWAVFSLAPLAYLGVLFLGAPWIMPRLGLPPFDPLAFLLREGSLAERSAGYFPLDAAATGVSLLADHLVPTFGPGWTLLGCAALALLLWAGRFRLRLGGAQRDVARRLALLAGGYILYQALMLKWTVWAVEHCYYYGMPFSLFMAMLLAILLEGLKTPARAAEPLPLLYLVAVSLANFHHANLQWMGRY